MSVTPSHPSPNQGSFVSGFVLGMCSGAVGYFLFKTEQGKVARTKLHQEWLEARQAIEETLEQAQKADQSNKKPVATSGGIVRQGIWEVLTGFGAAFPEIGQAMFSPERSTAKSATDAAESPSQTAGRKPRRPRRSSGMKFRGVR
jgi:hypothetical protein